MMNKVCIFTVVSKNYTHVARTLMHSVEQHYPEASRVVALCDRPDGFDYSRDNFEIFNLDLLDNIPSFENTSLIHHGFWEKEFYGWACPFLSVFMSLVIWGPKNMVC